MGMNKPGAQTYSQLVTTAGGVSTVGARIARWVSRESEKEAARVFGVSLRTVKSWRSGHLPQMRHLMAMTTRWGEAFLEDVFSPLLADGATLANRLERLEAEVAAIRREVVDTIDDFEEPATVDRLSVNFPVEHSRKRSRSGNVRNISRHVDPLGNMVEVTWLNALSSPPMLRFRQAMQSVAGGPPDFVTWDRQTYGLTGVHVLDVRDPDPNNWEFLARGWTGVDSNDCARIGDICLPAVKEQAMTSYLTAKAFADESIANVHRSSPAVGDATYQRVIIPQTDSTGRTRLLWVGIERLN